MISNAERGMPYKWYSCAATQKWKYLICYIIIDISLTLCMILLHSVLQGFHTGRFLFNSTAAVYNLDQCSLPLNLDAVKSPHHPYEPWILWKQMTAGNKSFSGVEICPQLNSWDRCECRSRFTQPCLWLCCIYIVEKACTTIWGAAISAFMHSRKSIKFLKHS